MVSTYINEREKRDYKRCIKEIKKTLRDNYFFQEIDKNRWGNNIKQVALYSYS